MIGNGDLTAYVVGLSVAALGIVYLVSFTIFRKSIAETVRRTIEETQRQSTPPTPELVALRSTDEDGTAKTMRQR